MARALIGLGANLGERSRTLSEAVRHLSELPETRLLAVSAWHKTAPVGGPEGQQEFLNGAALLETSLAAARLHDHLHGVEAALGRRRGRRWEARELDLDLLLYDDMTVETAELTVPHPGLAYRRFVLEPAAEIAADVVHPAIGWSLGRLLAHLNAAPNYLALAGGSASHRQEFAQRVAGITGARLLTLGDGHQTPPPVDASGPAADPPIQSLARGIEFLAAMERSLAAVSAASQGAAHVSDFWWGEFPAQIVGLQPVEQSRLLALWQAATSRVPGPRLIVTLDGRPDVRGVGPQLRLSPTRPLADACAEVAAAIEAMR